MAKIQKIKKPISKKQELFGAGIIAVIGIGIAATVLSVNQSTEFRQHASTFQNINTGNQIGQTNNPDGTMGPVDVSGNFSNTLPNTYLGTIDLQITDPAQGPRPTESFKDNGNNGNHERPTVTSSLKPTNIILPTHIFPSQAENGNDQDNNRRPSISPQNNTEVTDNSGGPQSVKALNITVTKAEVHLAHLGLPGERNEIAPSISISPTHGLGEFKEARRNNQDVNKWETLQIDAPRTFDLVALANNKSFPSLGTTQLANGRYTEIRFYLSSASATLTDNTTVPLVLLGKENIVRIIQPFVINSNKKTTLTMDFDAQNSVIKAGDKYLLKPVVAHLLSNYEK